MTKEDIPNIKRVIPIDFYELIIQFEDSTYRIFSPEKNKLYDTYSFLAYPNKLKSFAYRAEEIKWRNGVCFDKTFIYQNSEAVDFGDLRTKSITAGFRNQAPTDQHSTHHEYRFSIQPFYPEKPFVLSESIGGGHAEMGGSIAYSPEELLSNTYWKEHAEKSGCAWIIDIIEQNQPDIEKTIDLLVGEICQRSQFD